MWDGELATRVRERKLNEIISCAVMVKMDPMNRGRYADIINGLCKDVVACDELIRSEGAVKPKIGCVADQLYISSLSESDREDESAFNALKEPVAEEDADPMKEYVRSLLSEAVESIKGARDSEVVETLKEELSICRGRVDLLSNELDFANARAEEAESELEAIRSAEAETEAAPADVQAEPEAVVEEEQADSVEETAEPPAEEDIPEPVESYEDEEQSAEESEMEDSEEQPSAGHILDEEQISKLRSIREMKTSKIDYFINRSMDADEKSMDICDDIITFLKVDVDICDALIGMDQDDGASVANSFEKIVSILEDAPEPAHQDEYVSVLDSEEVSLERDYAVIIEHVQDTMLRLYSET